MSNSQWHEDQAHGERVMREEAAEPKLKLSEAKRLAMEVAREVYEATSAGEHPTLVTVVNMIFREAGFKTGRGKL